MTTPHEGTEARKQVVLVDGRPERRSVMARMIEVARPRTTAVSLAGNVDEAIALVARHHAGIALIEMESDPAEGIHTVGMLRARFTDLRIVVCSFHLGVAVREEMLAAGANACIPKPVSPAELRAMLDVDGRIESRYVETATEVGSAP